MAVLSVSEAARRWSVARSTLQRAIKEGRLSATTQPDGSRGIDTAELVRAFGEPPSTSGNAAGSGSSASAAPLQADTAALIASLQAQLAAAEERERWLRDRIESLEQRLLPAPRKPWFDRLAEALAKFRKQKFRKQ